MCLCMCLFVQSPLEVIRSPRAGVTGSSKVPKPVLGTQLGYSARSQPLSHFSSS